MTDYKLLYRAYGLLDAKSIQLLLQSFEIPSQVIQESAGVAFGFSVGKLGSANIYVEENRLEEAQHIIDLMEAGDLEIPNLDQESANVDDDFDQEDVDEEDVDEERVDDSNFEDNSG